MRGQNQPNSGGQVPLTVSTSNGTSSGTSPGTSVGTSAGTSSGTSSGTSPGTSPGTSHGASPGTSPGTSHGASPGTSHGTSPGTSPGTSHGTSPGTSPGTSEGISSSSTTISHRPGEQQRQDYQLNTQSTLEDILPEDSQSQSTSPTHKQTSKQNESCEPQMGEDDETSPTSATTATSLADEMVVEQVEAESEYTSPQAVVQDMLQKTSELLYGIKNDITNVTSTAVHNVGDAVRVAVQKVNQVTQQLVNQPIIVNADSDDPNVKQSNDVLHRAGNIALHVVEGVTNVLHNAADSIKSPAHRSTKPITPTSRSQNQTDQSPN